MMRATSTATCEASAEAAAPSESLGLEYVSAALAIAFDAPVNGATENSSVVTFPTATANWGAVTHFGIRDALTGGNLLYHGALSSARTILSGDTAKWNAGDLDITEA